MKLKQTLLILACVFTTHLIYGQTITNQFYNVVAGTGNGVKFWNSNNYKIHMGSSSKYHYGPVTGFSIKTNMSANAGRGWTWGILNQTPVYAVSNTGKVQSKGTITTMARRYYFGNAQNIYGDNSSALYYSSNNSSYSQLIMRDKENVQYGRLYGSANGTYFGLKDANNHWSYLSSKGSYVALRVSNDNKFIVRNTGLIQVVKNRDASGTPGSGSLEIAGGLRLDNNEIITNTNSTLLLNNDNNGNVHIDGTTFRVIANQNCVKIGSVSTAPFNNYKLFVEKGILTEKVKVAVKNTADWSDYVFEDDYEMMPIDQLEDYVSDNKHLPNVPSAQEMVDEGLDVAKMDAKLLEKIEEAHLYIIELHKELKELKSQVNAKN